MNLKSALRRYGKLRQEMDKLGQKLGPLQEVLMKNMDMDTPVVSGSYRIIKTCVPKTKIKAYVRREFHKLSFRVLGEKKGR